MLLVLLVQMEVHLLTPHLVFSRFGLAALVRQLQQFRQTMGTQALEYYQICYLVMEGLALHQRTEQQRAMVLLKHPVETVPQVAEVAAWAAL